eukprot:g67836.t1
MYDLFKCVNRANRLGLAQTRRNAQRNRSPAQCQKQVFYIFDDLISKTSSEVPEAYPPDPIAYQSST